MTTGTRLGELPGAAVVKEEIRLTHFEGRCEVGDVFCPDCRTKRSLAEIRKAKKTGDFRCTPCKRKAQRT
ncbi:MAG: hypothetical protein HY435_00390 [Candidatus Liptonbacteria bacterium]|nr:hypothetical protein [Candidatus Liptonbacteria bacterium]